MSIGKKIQIGEILQSLLPEFIGDTTSIVERTTEESKNSGSYSRTGKVVTISAFDHQLAENQRIRIDYLSGSGSSGFYSVYEVLDNNNFIVIDSISGSTNGTLNYSTFSSSNYPEFTTIESSSGSYDRFYAFLKQYYHSQEFQGGPVDIIDNLDQYLSFDNLVPEVLNQSVVLSSDITESSTTINVNNTRGFPGEYGLFRVNNEIITYVSKNETSFLGCIRGFSGITNYHDNKNQEELVFNTSVASSHSAGDSIENLSTLFLKEFFSGIKYSLCPGLEDKNFVDELNVGNFLKEARSLYETKGTEESFKILFAVLFGSSVKIIDLEQFLIKPSSAKYIRREVAVVEALKGNPKDIEGQTIFKKGDDQVTASISDVQPFTRLGKTYYRLFLFVGYDDATSYITGNFTITPSSLCSSNVAISTTSSEVVAVDSTVGFKDSGFFIANQQLINYEGKTINQFLGCYSDDGEISISKGDNIISSEIYFSYANGDINDEVQLRFTGVLDSINIVSNENEYEFLVGDKIFVRSLGEVIQNPDRDSTRLEILSNSLIYNTNCRFQINLTTINGSQFDIFTTPDNSNLKIGDRIEILERGTELVVPGLENISIIDISGRQITVDSNIEILLTPNEDHDLRRIHDTATINPDLNLSIKYGNNKILSNILNAYKESNTSLYAASNSLPSYEINPISKIYEIVDIAGFDPFDETYSILIFNNPVSFIPGNKVNYIFTGESIPGLDPDLDFYVDVISADKKQVKLYTSISLIGTEDFSVFGNKITELPTGTHFLSISRQKETEIYPQKLLRKFDLNPDIGTENLNETLVGPVGMMVNGVDIFGYKSNTKIYYGPIDSVSILNSGDGYDVINPPLLDFNSGSAKLQPVITGSFKGIKVSPQTFPIDDNVIITVSGGNGKGVILEPIIKNTQREVNFDARLIADGGGVDIDLETISFLTEHSFVDGQEIVYDSNGYQNLGIGEFAGSNLDSGDILVTNNTYFVEVLNNFTIKIYNSFTDSITGINTIGITTIGNAGIQKFKTLKANSLSDIIVNDGGSGYSNRTVIVSPSGISTSYDTVTFKNHGFSEGELVEYRFENDPIVGLNTENSFYISKIDDDSFRVSDAGIGGTSRKNYDRGKYVRFSDSGSGYQIFKYPDISLSIEYTIPGVGSTLTTEIDAIPIVRGGFEDIFVYEGGVGYGSSLLNLKVSPKINIRNGKDAQFRATVNDGEIVSVVVQYGGLDYYSYPDLEVISSTGTGCVLKPRISNGKITSVEILKGGSNYDPNDTIIRAVSAGINAKINANVRELVVNNAYLLGTYEKLDQTGVNFYRKPASEVTEFIIGQELQYGVLSYSSAISDVFNDDGLFHSPIIGWAFDGNPIYGPYGFSDPEDIDSPIKHLTPGYGSTAVYDRPIGFDDGFFIEDYVYDNSGDLDKYNGRFGKTPDFPNGVYAYFASVEQDITSSSIIGRFPYFIGEYYRSNFDKESFMSLDQNFDFNSSSLIRNTLPYAINEEFAGNDFITESNELLRQSIQVESTTKGLIKSFNIVESGNGYKIGDRVVFEESDSNVSAKVSRITGKEILEITTDVESYDSAILTWENSNNLRVTIPPKHNLEIGDNLSLSGLSTNLYRLTDNYSIGIVTYATTLRNDLNDFASSGIVTTIGLSYIPPNVSVGSSILIEDEEVSVLNVFDRISALRILRSPTGVAHSSNSPIYVEPNSFTVEASIDKFDSRINDLVYFNPKESIGIGTTPGVSTLVSFSIDGTTYNTNLNTQSIFIPNHPFKTNQKVILTRTPSDSGFIVRNTPDSGSFNFPVGLSQDCYVINQSQDYIGLVTDVGITTISNGLYFTGSGSNSWQYSLESDYKQEYVDVNRYKVTVVTTEPHKLSEKDKVFVSVSGISTEAKSIKYNEDYNLLLLNERNISAGINSESNLITFNDHGYTQGQKIFYDSSDTISQGLTTGFYHVLVIDDNNFKLTETFNDTKSEPPLVVSIESLGGSGQVISEINPKISIVKNNSLIFDLSDSSLIGYDFNLYYDKNYHKEFISVESDEFNLTGIGTPGYPGSNLTLEYSENLPEFLYYNVESSGLVSDSDKTFFNYSEIEYVDSLYNGEFVVYNAIGSGSTTFNISIFKNPESLSYTQNVDGVLKYETNSNSSDGGILKLKIEYKGNLLDSLPTFSDIESDAGSGAYLIPKSDDIGKLKDFSIVVNGFDYPYDNTLRPTASVPLIIDIIENSIIEEVTVDFPGENYLEAPNLITVNETTGEVLDSLLVANLSGFGIDSVDVILSPQGLTEEPISIKSIDNSNGIPISQVQYNSASGIVTCILTTPISGFIEDPFAFGDEIFVENILTDGSGGDGFNSSDYGYRFFDVASYDIGSNPGTLTYNLSGLTTNAGVPLAIQGSFATIVNKKNYPILTPIQNYAKFFEGEQLSIDSGFGFEDVDLTVTSSASNFIRVSGSYVPLEDQIVRGRESIARGRIEEVKDLPSTTFLTSAYASERIGWFDDVGKLSNDFQVIENNDYYQNLSYSIKSDRTWDSIVSSVNDLLHTSGLKNFADVQFSTNVSTLPVGFGTGLDTTLVIISDTVSESRVDVINDFDLTIDLDILP